VPVWMTSVSRSAMSPPRPLLSRHLRFGLREPTNGSKVNAISKNRVS
jgi:hypothetical protein